VEHKTNSGPCKYLNEDEEKELAMFLKESAAMGYGKSRKDVMNITEAYAKPKGVLRKNKVTQGWWRDKATYHYEEETILFMSGWMQLMKIPLAITLLC